MLTALQQPGPLWPHRSHEGVIDVSCPGERYGCIKNRSGAGTPYFLRLPNTGRVRRETEYDLFLVTMAAANAAARKTRLLAGAGGLRRPIGPFLQCPSS